MAEQQKARKTTEEINRENLAVAERVLAGAQARAVKAAAAQDKAQADLAQAERRVRAQRMLVGEDEAAAAGASDEDVL